MRWQISATLVPFQYSSKQVVVAKTFLHKIEDSFQILQFYNISCIYTIPNITVLQY